MKKREKQKKKKKKKRQQLAISRKESSDARKVEEAKRKSRLKMRPPSGLKFERFKKNSEVRNKGGCQTGKKIICEIPFVCFIPL